MKLGAALLVAAVALSALSTAAGAPSQRLVPTTVAFSDRSHGILGLSSPHCTGCAASGAIAMTSNGGKTWRIAVRTQRRVVAAGYYKYGYDVSLEGHRSLWTDEAGHWHRSPRSLSFDGHCPKSWKAGYSADLVDVNIETPWSICTGLPGAGTQAKGVYRGKARVAYTPEEGRPSGGIGRYGYALGIAGSEGGFGLIWESRGTLYVSRDGGRHWHALPRVSQPEVDFGMWASTVANTGFVLLERNGHTRLIETRDAGRTWRVVHRWR